MKTSSNFTTFGKSLTGGNSIFGFGFPQEDNPMILPPMPIPSFPNECTTFTPGIIPNGEKPTESSTRGTLTKVIEVIDPVSNRPIVGAHITPANVITDHNGMATISVNSPDQVITITHVGKKTHAVKFKDLGDLISLQPKAEELDAVVLKGDPVQAKANKTLLTGLVIAGAIFGISYLATREKPKSKKVVTV